MKGQGKCGKYQWNITQLQKKLNQGIHRKTDGTKNIVNYSNSGPVYK